MKVSIFTLFFVLNSIVLYSYPIKSISMDNDNMLCIHYDSLYNIGYSNETETSIKRYIGQELIFLKRDNTKSLPEYYANFDYPKPVVIDTIWFKIRKNKKKIKPTDYKLITTTSYKPVYVKDEVVVLAGADAYHYEKKVIRDLFSYQEKSPKRNGYFTHYSSIEGETFKILDVTIEDVGSLFKSFIFKLQSKENQILYWTAECNTMNYKKISYPVVIKGFLDKIRDKYVNKSFYFYSPEYSGEKYFCKNIVYKSNNSGYNSLYMEMCSHTDELYLPLIKTPKIFNSERYEDGELLIEERRLIPEEIFEKEKIEYDEKQAEIKLNEEKEKKRHELDIKKKYGSYYGKLILQNKVSIGMSKEMVKESWGIPEDINRTITENCTYEQWDYGNGNYLYFENGKLTAIQD